MLPVSYSTEEAKRNPSRSAAATSSDSKLSGIVASPVKSTCAIDPLENHRRPRPGLGDVKLVGDGTGAQILSHVRDGVARLGPAVARHVLEADLGGADLGRLVAGLQSGQRQVSASAL